MRLEERKLRHRGGRSKHIGAKRRGESGWGNI